MMNKKGIDYEFLNEFQNKLDNEAEAISIQLIEKLESFGDVIKQETGILPIAKEFVNWYLDNHYTSKKRRLPVKLSNELILQYCFEYKEELERNARKFNLKQDYNTKLKNNIENILNFEFRNDSKMTKESFEELKLNLLYILTNQELPKEYTVLETNEIGLDNEFIRYCFFQIYKLDKTTMNRKLLVHFLYLKFKAFYKSDFNPDYIMTYTHYKKLSTPPFYYLE